MMSRLYTIKAKRCILRFNMTYFSFQCVSTAFVANFDCVCGY